MREEIFYVEAAGPLEVWGSTAQLRLEYLFLGLAFDY